MQKSQEGKELFKLLQEGEIMSHWMKLNKGQYMLSIY